MTGPGVADPRHALAVVLERHGDIATLVLGGELDLAGAAVLHRALGRLRDSAPEEVVIDLGRLEFMDSSGLRSLFAADLLCRLEGRRLALKPGPESVQRIFVLTGTSGHFRFIG